MIRRDFKLIRIVLLLAASAAVAPFAISQVTALPAPPKTEEAPVTDTYYGVSVTDPYRWL